MSWLKKLESACTGFQFIDIGSQYERWCAVKTAQAQTADVDDSISADEKTAKVLLDLYFSADGSETRGNLEGAISETCSIATQTDKCLFPWSTDTNVSSGGNNNVLNPVEHTQIVPQNSTEVPEYSEALVKTEPQVHTEYVLSTDSTSPHAPDSPPQVKVEPCDMDLLMNVEHIEDGNTCVQVIEERESNSTCSQIDQAQVADVSSEDHDTKEVNVKEDARAALRKKIKAKSKRSHTTAKHLEDDSGSQNISTHGDHNLGEESATEDIEPSDSITNMDTWDIVLFSEGGRLISPKTTGNADRGQSVEAAAGAKLRLIQPRRKIAGGNEQSHMNHKKQSRKPDYKKKPANMSKGSKQELCCEICGYQSSSQRNFNRHYNNKHSGPLEKLRFDCPECQKQFASLRYLDMHKQVEHGDRLFLCELCSQSFTTNSGLYKHRRSLHEDRPCHTCPICGKTFMEKRRYSDHMDRHQGFKRYQCSKCQKSYSGAESLKRHMLTCNENKVCEQEVFKCEICDKTFKTKSYFKFHFKIKHATSKGFECSCGQKFTFPGSLCRHMKSCKKQKKQS